MPKLQCTRGGRIQAMSAGKLDNCMLRSSPVSASLLSTSTYPEEGGMQVEVHMAPTNAVMHVRHADIVRMKMPMVQALSWWCRQGGYGGQDGGGYEHGGGIQKRRKRWWKRWDLSWEALNMHII